jgi:esterase/lipase superfamily enzyme
MALPGEPEYDLVSVFFGTNRQRVNSNNYKSFTGPRGAMQYGTASVSVPKDRLIGSIRRPAFYEFWVMSEDKSRFFTISQIRMLSGQDFFSRAGNDLIRIKAVSGAPERAAFLFVHGFNVPFDDALFRAAQVSHDIGFKGTTFLFSWPAGAVYPYAKTAMDESKRPLKDFITNILDRSKPDRLYIVAHSMGTRGVSLALSELAQSRPDLKTKIGALVLASPDISRQVFIDDVAPNLARMARSVTSYVSNKDIALVASKKFNGSYALGDAGGQVPIISGMTTVDASNVDTNFLGHSAYGDEPELLRDIQRVFAGAPPTKRTWLRPQPTPRGAYYRFAAPQ